METPTCERNINAMFHMTLIPCINTTYFKIVPFIVVTGLLGATLCPLYYPAYYEYQPEIYSVDLSMVFIVYSYLVYTYLKWEKKSCFEHTAVSRLDENTSLSFYILFMVYWLYDAVLQFSYHHDANVVTQVGNVFMSLSWYIYFSTSSLLYYFICIKLAQRTQSINNWLKKLKRERPPINVLYDGYKRHHKAIKEFGRYWNFIIFMGFVILTYHIPIDIFNVVLNHRYTDIVGIAVKTLGLCWYTYKICELNDMDNKVVSYLYTHNLYSIEDMEMIEKYTTYQGLGLNFYGLTITGSLVVKLGLPTINLIIPTLYALVSNKLIGNVGSK